MAWEQRPLIGDRTEESCSGVGDVTLTDCIVRCSLIDRLDKGHKS